LSETSFLLYGTPAWNAIMQLPIGERIAAFADPAARHELVEAANATLLMLMYFLRVGETYSTENKALEGRLLSEVASEMGKAMPDAMLDIAVRDDLRTEFQLKGAIHADPDQVIQLLENPLIHIGASDAGAHVSQFCGAGDTSDLLDLYVRRRGDMTLERAVHRLTGELAEAWGIANRGLIREGYAADLVIFDPDTIARGKEQFVSDFPGEAHRYICHAEGVDTVIVNGAVVRDAGRYTDARTGVIV
jgi:N-acyl-D-amino-acid deacylase